MTAAPRPDALTTARFALRPLGAADAQELHALWTAPGVRRFLWDDEVIPRAQTDEIVARSAELFAGRGLGLWGARARDRGAHDALAGFAGYWYFRDPPELELLYGVAEPGRGAATEIARALVDYGFDALGFDEIRASTDAAHAASARVLDKLGFTLERRATAAGLDTLFYRRRPT